MNKLKLIKTIVFALTFLLIIGTLLLFSSVYKRINKEAPAKEIVLDLSQPVGSEIVDFKIVKDEVYLLVKKGGLSDRVVIYNKKHNMITNSINIE